MTKVFICRTDANGGALVVQIKLAQKWRSGGRKGRCVCNRTGYRLTGGGPSGVLPGARELCPVAVSGAGLVAVGM